MCLCFIRQEDVWVGTWTLITRTLIFPISTLNLFVLAFLHFTFKYASPLGFVETSDFQDLGRVEPRV